MYWVGWLHHTVLWWISPTLRLTFILKSLLTVSLSLSSRGKKIWVDIKCWYTHLGQLQLLPCAQSSMLNEQEQHGIFFCPGFCFPGCTVRMAYFTGEDFFFFSTFLGCTHRIPAEWLRAEKMYCQLHFLVKKHIEFIYICIHNIYLTLHVILFDVNKEARI